LGNYRKVALHSTTLLISSYFCSPTRSH